MGDEQHQESLPRYKIGKKYTPLPRGWSKQDFSWQVKGARNGRIGAFVQHSIFTTPVEMMIKFQVLQWSQQWSSRWQVWSNWGDLDAIGLAFHFCLPCRRIALPNVKSIYAITPLKYMLHYYNIEHIIGWPAHHYHQSWSERHNIYHPWQIFTPLVLFTLRREGF